MNRHERRKATVFTPTILSVDEIKGSNFICIWDGCPKTYPYHGNMPPDWAYLITYWSKRPHVVLDFVNGAAGTRWGYDAVLCPEHNKALAALLKPVLPDPQLLSEPQGNA